jgi:hypothetical protein
MLIVVDDSSYVSITRIRTWVYSSVPNGFEQVLEFFDWRKANLIGTVIC